jgi:tRNA (guanine37-N1)-methyltransferase
VLRVDVFTIFPAMVESFAAAILLGRAGERGLLDVRVHDLR